MSRKRPATSVQWARRDDFGDATTVEDIPLAGVYPFSAAASGHVFSGGTRFKTKDGKTS